jgi:hypothetical protein
VLGARTEPEDLKRSFGSFESLGWRLAEDCASGTGGAWTDPLLAHNEMQLSRMVADVRPFVFSPSA